MKPKKSNNKNKWKACNIKMSINDYNEISKLVEDGIYLNHSDFIRHTVKNELKNYKIENNQNKNIFNKIEDS